MVQTLVDATRNIGLYDPARSSLAAWLYGIARRHIQTQRRQQSRRKTIPSSAQVSLESMGEIADTDDLENDVAARLEARRKVARIATLLSDLEMEVLLLRYVDGLSVKEVAGIVGRSEKAVDSLLHRAKQRAQKGVTESAE
jgi:RNA polymerase sigma-70 factor (ECF subfamily)